MFRKFTTIHTEDIRNWLGYSSGVSLRWEIANLSQRIFFFLGRRWKFRYGYAILGIYTCQCSRMLALPVRLTSTTWYSQ